MADAVSIDAVLIALVGGAVVAAVLVESLCTRLAVPPLVGHLLLGVAARPLGEACGLLTEPVLQAFRLLADLGIVALLFAVGLESHPRALAAKLPEALPVGLGNVVGSALVAFAAARWWLELPLPASLVCATALSATSVGVAVGLWRDAGRLASPEGELLVDVAELDDVAAMALMAVTFALVPVLGRGGGVDAGIVGAELLGFTLRFGLFLGLCLLFARQLEPRVLRLAGRLAKPPERMVLIAGFGLLIASAAGLLGFSLAIGALFAGLVFSRDTEVVRTEDSFRDLHAFVTPFFFIGTGLQVAPETLVTALPIATVLLLAAVLGKFVGTTLPALLVTSTGGALLLGLSMLPRAEIALVVFDQGHRRAPELVGTELYSAGVLVALVTCVLVSVLLGPLLGRGRGGT